LPFYGDKVLYPNHVHKPEADKDFGSLQRTSEVLDCWFDSGAMPFAAFDTYQQADVICEAIDQTRGWFYSLLAIGTAIKGQSPYKRVVCLGHILGKHGEKMSKSKGNVVDPWKLFEKYGADAVRWFMVSNPIGNSITFNEDLLKSIVQNIINRLWNSYTFFETYAAIEKPTFSKCALTPIDRWLMVRLQQVVNFASVCYDGYRFSELTTCIEKFIDDLSNVWIRANRYRFWNTDNQPTDEAAFMTLRTVLTTLSLVVAPIMPFMSETIWRSVQSDSVHLQDFPTISNLSSDDEELLAEMERAIEIVSEGHNLREQAGIKVRQALSKVYIPDEISIFADFVKNELNVKEIVRRIGPISLNTTLTEDLLAEGFAREFVRVVQNLRKEAKLQVVDRIVLTVDYRSEQVKSRLLKHRDDIMKKLLATEWVEGVAPDNKVGNFVVGICCTKS